MTLHQRRLRAGAVLLAFAVTAVAWLLRLDYRAKISTDALDLIPKSEQAPEIALVRELASKGEARTMLFVLREADGKPAPADAAQRFAAELGKSPAFAKVLALTDTGWRDALGRELFESRFTLLFPLWVRDGPRSPGEIARELKAFTARPEGLAFQDLLPADPLLLLPRTLERLKHGLPLVGNAAGGSGLVWAQTAASPLSEEGQQPVFDAIERAAGAVGTELQLTYTGVNRFAAASRARIEAEVGWLNTASLLAVLAVAALFIRRVHLGLHLVPVVLLAMAGGVMAVTLAFDRVHIVVLVIGSLLAGVAIDYGFYLYMQPPARPGEDYGEKVRRLRTPLLASCATTVAGFAMLLISELPLVRQLGVFVAAGLITALVVAVLYFSLLENPFLEPRRFGSATNAAGRPGRGRRRVVVLLAWALLLPGLARLTWRDDIRDLEIPSAELKRNDAAVRAAFGESATRTAFLTHGTSRDAAREALDRFEAWLRGRAEFANLGAIVPTQADFSNALRLARERREFPSELRAALDREGFESAEFAAFFAAYEAFATGGKPSDLDDALRRLEAKLAGPAGLLLHLAPGRNWFVTLANGAGFDAPPPGTQTIAASQLQSLNRLFIRYRQSALRLSLIGLGLVGLGVVLTYGVRDGVRIFAIPLGACLGIFGLLGWLGQPLNLFHLLGAFLGVCLTHNYSIFTAASAYRREPPPVSVRLSALTTAASFGVLALSSIPVVRALGLTVAAMVVIALLMIEVEHLSPLAKPA